jgi:acyl-CoA reductase-like NAD-dependent aldehyde dehydrogenase
VPQYANGHFVRPTVLETANPMSELSQTEIFGLVLTF